MFFALKSRYQSANERTVRAAKNVTFSFFSRVVSLIITFLVVPLSLSYVGKTEYGIWITISSIITWFSYFDIGLGNGLRNKLAETLAKNDITTAKMYISSSYAVITIISMAMFVCFTIAAYFMPWNRVLNTDVIPNTGLLKVVVTVFFFFCISFSMKTLSSILQAMQLYAINDLIGVASQLIGLCVILVLVNTSSGSLFYLSLVLGSQAALGLIIGSIVLFSTKLKNFKPELSNVNFKQSLPLLNIGAWFFLNQILYLITTQASIFIVAQLYGPGDVTLFNLAKNYMSITSMLYIMVLTPFLSAFTEAYTKKDYSWIRRTIKTINIVWILTSLAVIILIFGYRLFFNLWVGGEVMPPLILIVFLGILSIFETYTSTYSLFLNGIGKIRLQFFTLLASAIVFVPMVLIFHHYKFGLVSLVLPGILFAIVNSIIYKIQYNKIITKSASGIWFR